MSKTCRVGWRRRKTKSDGRGTGPELLITHYTSEQHIFLDVVAPLGTAMSICRSGINHIVMSLSSCDAKGAVPDSNSKMLSLRTLLDFFSVQFSVQTKQTIALILEFAVVAELKRKEGMRLLQRVL